MHALNFGATAVDYFAKVDDELLVVLQCEHIQAVENADAIFSVPGIDVIFVGPNDLTQALGVPGQYTDPRYKEALGKIARQAKASEKAAGIMLGKASQIPELGELGYTFFTTSDRALFLESARLWRQALGSSSR